MRKPDLDRLLIQDDVSVREAISAVDRGGVGIALLVDQEGRLLATITDGDIRRAILHGVSQDAPVTALLGNRSEDYRKPIAASTWAKRSEILHMMQQRNVRHVPLLDAEQRLVDLVLLSEFACQPRNRLSAVVMAGGLGTRLRPLTQDVPKPMLPVGGRPVLERIVEQLREAGINSVRVATNHRAEKIIEHLGDGRRFGVQIDYPSEDEPLGTAGALGMVEPSDWPLLVVNGDVVTKLNFRSMLDFHQEHGADLTVAVRKYEFCVPYGVVESEGVKVLGLVEKPSLGFFVNAGVYVMEQSAHREIPLSRRSDMTDLIQILLGNGQSVVSFPIHEYWLDIGHLEDYRQAQEDAESGRLEE